MKHTNWLLKAPSITQNTPRGNQPHSQHKQRYINILPMQSIPRGFREFQLLKSYSRSLWLIEWVWKTLELGPISKSNLKLQLRIYEIVSRCKLLFTTRQDVVSGTNKHSSRYTGRLADRLPGIANKAGRIVQAAKDFSEPTNRRPPPVRQQHRHTCPHNVVLRPLKIDFARDLSGANPRRSTTPLKPHEQSLTSLSLLLLA
ncbi:hypothetical protein J6590_017188 [Homalodisca vitripennis]|nr:hypothetical protein J6590_017188 [Homalodisca vitripennis]